MGRKLGIKPSEWETEIYYVLYIRSTFAIKNIAQKSCCIVFFFWLNKIVVLSHSFTFLRLNCLTLNFFLGPCPLICQMFLENIFIRFVYS